MNRGHVSPVQQMVAAGNPNSWWNMINTMRQPPQQFQHQHQHHQQASRFLPPHPSNLFPQYAPPAPNSSSSQLPFHLFYDNQELHHESLSQLLMSGLVGEDLDHKGGMNHFHEAQAEKNGMNHFHEAQAEKKINNNWEEQVMHHHQASNNVVDDHVKQEHNMFGQHASHEDDQFQQQQQQVAAANKSIWSPVMLVSNSPNSCVTTANSNMMNFSGKNDGRHPPPDRSSESNSSTSSGGALKKARVQPSTTQSASTTVKVRKEKLGDRITALHQLVSPFGKTDTASVLLEAIGYIRFLQNQIEALSLPYLGSGSGNNIRQQQQQHSVQGERNCIFPEDPGQLLNDNCLKRKGASHDNMGSHEEAKKDLRSKGLCLVPVSCTLQVGSDNGADYWAPAMGGGGFR